MSKKTSLLLTIVSLTIYSSFVFASDLPYKSGELIVRFAPKPDGKQLTIAERSAILDAIDGGTIKRSSKLVPGLTLVKLPANTTVENSLAAFKNVNGILYAEPNYRVKALSLFPDDTYFPNQWGLHDTGLWIKDADIDAPEAWDIATGNSEIIVAVIDTGVDYNHIDLAGNMWVNEAEFYGEPNVDDDGNEKIDDIYGYDFCTYQGHQRDSDPMDDSGHGTACAGIVGAIGNNNEGVAGVCWNVKIMAVKFINYNGYGWSYDAIDSIEYTVDMGAKVLSNSWGYCEGHPHLVDPNALQDAVQAACANGVLFVAAAGNAGDEPVIYPARYPETIAVGATDESDYRWSYSNYGDELNVVAPSGDGWITPFWTTDITGSAGYNPGFTGYGDAAGNYYKWFGGTSAAAPQVAGLAALILSVNPFLTSDEVQSIIESTADDKGAPGRDQYYGYGRINVYNALIGAGKQPGLLAKADNLDPNNSVLPNDSITYTISYENNLKDPNDPNLPLETLTNVTITDRLPPEVDYEPTSDPNYDPNNHTYTWNIGTVEPNESNSVTLTVTVNELAEPLGTIVNICVIDANEIPAVTAVEVTDVNFWVPDVIYVDVSKEGLTGSRYDTGMSWENAYIDLQDATERARLGCGRQIWVAAGTYIPATDPEYADVTFGLVNGIALYGGFAGTETALSQRNLADPNNETVLTGDTDNDGEPDWVDSVVTVSDVNNATIIDGFTITKGVDAGIWCEDNGSPAIRNNKVTGSNYSWEFDSGAIYCDNSSPHIINCNIKDNRGHGISCKGSSEPNIIGCTIEDNDLYGICYKGVGNIYVASLVITNSVIRSNGQNGIYCEREAPVIKNNFISGDDGSSNDHGIYLEFPETGTVVRNNTVVYNVGCGIYLTGITKPPVSNCIIWGETPLYETGYDVTYSCIEDGYTGVGNISTDPCFVDDANDNYHLTYDSNCIDAGDPNYLPEPNETDIDGQPRNMGDCNETVDIGADEVYFPPCWNYLTQCYGDADGDRDVDLTDFYVFRDSFGIDYWNDWNNGAGPYNPCADYDRDGDGDLADFIIFRDHFGDINLPPDCNCGCAPCPDCWPPEPECGGGEGRGQSSGDTTDESALEDMINWIIENDLPGCEEFIRRLYEQL